MPEILPYHQEVYRKIIHISSSVIALFLSYFGKDVLLPWMLVVAILFPALDYSRKHILFLKNIYFAFFRNVTRPSEFHALSGASWIFMGAGITAYMFNEKTAVIALLVMSLSDSAAALIGIKYGNTRLFSKSLEGSLAFFITTYMIIFTLSPASMILTLIVTCCATIIELFSFPKLNDNIIIPVVTALTLTLGGIH